MFAELLLSYLIGHLFADRIGSVLKYIPINNFFGFRLWIGNQVILVWETALPRNTGDLCAREKGSWWGGGAAQALPYL